MAPSSRRRVLGGIALITLAGCIGDDEDDAADDDDDDVERTGPSIGDQELSHSYPVQFDDADTDANVPEVHYHGDGEANWHYQPLAVPLDATRQLSIRVLGADDAALSLDGYTIEATVGDAERLEAAIQGAQLALTGLSPGEVDLSLTFRNDGASWTTPPLEVAIED